MNNIVGVLLAAGNSTRFGSHKLGFALDAEHSIGQRSALNLISALDSCIAVVRRQDQAYIDQLEQLGFQTVVQPAPEAGMGNSLALAIRSSWQADGWLIALADMPWIKASLLAP